MSPALLKLLQPHQYMMPRAIVKLLRPHQYIKNGFVLIGALFSHQWDAVTLVPALLAFLSFCAIASAVYTLNDIVDVDADREHPVKNSRPLPSGAVPLAVAWWLFGVLTLVALGLALIVSGWVVAFVTTYLIMNLAYSARLKHIVVLDVFVISTGFMLRILAGTVGLDVPPSQWILLCGLMMTLLLGFTKRRAEQLMLQASGGTGRSSRRVLDDYSPAMLDQFIAITATGVILSYSLYTVAPTTVELHGSDNLVYTLPFVIYGIFRYLYLLNCRSRGNDTAKDLLTDSHLLATVGIWIAVTLWVLA